MTRPIYILISLSLLAAVAFLASTVSAECATCGGAGENWDASAASFLEGKSIEDNPAPRWGPAVARETNSQFSTNKTQEAAANASEEASSAPKETSSTEKKAAQSFDLLNATANPNPANPGSPVSIAAILGENLGENATAYSIIRNSAGVQVGNVTLEKTSSNGFVGSWTASIATDTYTVSIIASDSGISKAFENALKIAVVDSGSTSGTSSRYKKLG